MKLAVVLTLAVSLFVAEEGAAVAADASGTDDAPAPAGTPADTPAEAHGFDADTDHLRFGLLGGIGLPRPLAIEALLKIERVVGIGVEYSLLPRMNLFGVETTYWAVAADLRVFPFRGGFFLGLRAGYQQIGAAATLAVSGLGSMAETATATSTFVNPRLGFLWTWANGFTVGVDAGVQLPLSTSMETSLPPALAELAEVSSSMTRVASTLGHDPIPTVDLLRVGFLF